GRVGGGGGEGEPVQEAGADCVGASSTLLPAIAPWLRYSPAPTVLLQPLRRWASCRLTTAGVSAPACRSASSTASIILTTSSPISPFERGSVPLRIAAQKSSS